MTDRTPPIHGERVLFCPHADVSEFHINLKAPTHWYSLGDNEAQDTRTGETFSVHWLALCDDCHKQVKDVQEAHLLASQDAPWIGDPPTITHYA
jgi:hypothetical protein